MRYCKYCGEKINDDAVFCHKCGKQLTMTIASNRRTSDNNSVKAKVKKEDNHNANDNSGDGTGWHLLACIAFVVLSYFIAPNFGIVRIGAALIISTVVITITSLIVKMIKHRRGKKIVAITISLLMIVIPAGLILLYNGKVDNVSTPKGGSVYVQFTYEDEYYNSTGTGYVHNPNPGLDINGSSVGSGGIRKITIGDVISIKAHTYYTTDNGKSRSGKKEIKKTVSSSFLNKTFNIDMNTGSNESCTIKITTAYKPDFWDVILF